MVQIDLRNESGVTIAVITGDIDGQSAPQVQERLLPVFEACSNVILDMSGVAFLSSAGLRTLLLLYRQATARNGKVVLVGLAEQIADTMSITGFLGFFTVCPTIAEALNALKQ